jgi:glutathione S-transferase
MLVLYYAPGASSMAVHIALHEIGVPFEGRVLSWTKREQRSAAFLAVNPEGKVPTLLIDGRPLTEVAGILFYLARRFPAAGLLPEGIEGEAQAVSWMSFIAATLHPARRVGVEYGYSVYGIVEQRLGEQDWLLGRYSVADIHLFRLFWRFHEMMRLTPERFPRLHGHYARMMARPAVQRTIAAEAAIGYEIPTYQPPA